MLVIPDVKAANQVGHRFSCCSKVFACDRYVGTSGPWYLSQTGPSNSTLDVMTLKLTTLTNMQTA